MAMSSPSHVQNVKATLEAQNQMLREQMLTVAKMLDVSFEKLDAFRSLVVEFPEECHRMSPLINCKNVNPKAIDKLTLLGQNIAVCRAAGIKPRLTTIYRYRILATRIIIVAAKHSPEVLIGLIFGDKTDQIMKAYDREPGDEQQSILNLGGLAPGN